MREFTRGLLALCFVISPAVAAAPDSDGETSTEIDWAAARRFWAFRLPVRHARPAVENDDWVRQPIDAFVLARLEKAGIAPNPPADRRTLIRRVTLDLIGLPPTPQAVEAFVHDRSPNAYEALVDRLIASPRYGERWARLWLDVARFAEDQAHIVGTNKSQFYPNAYRYRDWVIRALNDDMPYDRFVKLQLAADLLDDAGDDQHVALGFLGLGPKYYNRKRLDVMADEWEDRVDTVTRGLLGLTVACARCHDHKYDPIPTEDYYALAGVFASTDMISKKLSEDEDDTIHIVREAEPRDLNVFLRGNVQAKGPLVKRRFLTVLSEGEPVAFTRGSGRLDMAEAIVNRRNPLAARVIVNRLWRVTFGHGLVETPSNFGKAGRPPTHPALLDDLAVRFMENGWSLKSVLREIVLSATYGQQSRRYVEKQAKDPANRLLWRSNRRRLDVETWRDSILAATGQLDASMGGASMDPNDPNVHRRTLYAYISRFELSPLLALFDFPDPNVHSAKRALTTTPLQKLFVMNSAFILQQAEALAARFTKDADETPAQRIARAYQLLYARPPTDAEVQAGLDFLGSDSSRWTQYAQVLLAANELLYTN